MLQDWEKLAKVLDLHRPGWAIKWAEQHDLQDLARGEIKIETLKYRVALDLFHPILHAATEAGLVKPV